MNVEPSVVVKDQYASTGNRCTGSSAIVLIGIRQPELIASRTSSCASGSRATALTSSTVVAHCVAFGAATWAAAPSRADFSVASPNALPLAATGAPVAAAPAGAPAGPPAA